MDFYVHNQASIGAIWPIVDMSSYLKAEKHQIYLILK